MAKTAAKTQPANAGSMIFLYGIPPRIRRTALAVKAAGMKNMRLTVRAVCGSIFMTNVSQSSRRLPPPVPNPVRNPNIPPKKMEKAVLLSINTESLRNRSSLPKTGAAIPVESVFPAVPPESPREFPLQEKARPVPMAGESLY